MSTGVKLSVGAVVMAVALGYLAIVGAAGSWQYYLTVDEAGADAVSLQGKRVRVSGRVADGSLAISENRRHASFQLCGQHYSLNVNSRGILPDNLAEGMDVVAEGRIEGGGLRCDKVITRCASKYEPRADATGKDSR
jgi:cytochrome c-type biogenesis protein CcmE